VTTEYFPTTAYDELTPLIEAGDPQRHASRHIMDRYYEPLQAYICGLPLRVLGEPDDLVRSFFASRLSRADYLRNWSASGLPLRRYLMNGISFHLRELLRERVRCKTLPIVDESILVSKSLRADELFERAWALSILSDACTASRDAMAADGRSNAWRIFDAHYLRGESFVALALREGVSPQRLAAEARFVIRRVERVLQSMLSDEGIPTTDLAAEVARIQGLLKS
jgi:hypothetical protein